MAYEVLAGLPENPFKLANKAEQTRHIEDIKIWPSSE